MGSKIDLLSKSELEYELKLRNFDPDVKSTCSMLRKKLRQLIKNKVERNVTHLCKKVTLQEELEYIDISLKVLCSKLDDLNETSRPIDILRYEAKSEHLNLRIDNFRKFKISDEMKKSIEKYADELKALDLRFQEINKNIDTDVKEVVLRKLSQSNMEEEDLDDVFENVNIDSKHKPTSEEKEMVVLLDGNKSTKEEVVNADMKDGTSISPKVDEEALRISSLESNGGNPFAKLPNPIMKYFENLQVCDGLKADPLLKFLGVALRLKTETSLTNMYILEMCQQYCKNPLLNKLLECKSTHRNLDIFHKEVLSCFIPLGLREKLKRDLVTRPQLPNEPLHAYVCMVKENSKLLCCNYTEEELVNLICMNMNQEERSRLVFLRAPRSFADLHELCIQSQNIGYANWERNILISRGKMAHQINKNSQNARAYNVNNIVRAENSPIKCFNCDKIGHIARNCYRPRQWRNNQNVQSNGARPPRPSVNLNRKGESPSGVASSPH